MFQDDQKILGYCTNVHAGTDIASTKANLDRYAVGVRERVSPGAPMGIGLWLPASAARELLETDQVGAFRDWLEERGLHVFTMNGFPYGDFHDTVVKHSVYEPTWADNERMEYTMQLVRILGNLLPKDAEGSISTLPIGWPSDDEDADEATLSKAADKLLELADFLAREEAATGHCIHVDIEPEPGCLLDTTADIIEFFEDRLYAWGERNHIARYLRVCHDVCHAAVMGEEQGPVLGAYAEAGIRVGKVQISSAVAADFRAMTPEVCSEALAQLARFQEPRYLHQTMVDDEAEGYGLLYEDLPEALEALQQAELGDLSLRTHFHVPVYLDNFGHLKATQADVRECLSEIAELSDCRHFEVETYAWNVLPKDLQVEDLAEGIAREMQWVLDSTRAETRPV